MIPIRIVETDRDDFDQPVVELWRDDEFIGMVFWDEDTTFVQIYPDDDGDVKDIDLGDLMRSLELAERIVSPLADDDEFLEIRSAFGSSSAEDDGDEWETEHPATVALVEEFDPQAVHRTGDGEGFFPREAAIALVDRCDQLDLAVMEMEGFDLKGDSLVPLDLSFAVSLDDDIDWDVFRATANGRSRDTLADWPDQPSLVVAFVIRQPDGEDFVA